MNFVDKQELANETLLSFVFPKAPKKIFSGDFNNDGMPDLLFTYDGGYKSTLIMVQIVLLLHLRNRKLRLARPLAMTS